MSEFRIRDPKRMIDYCTVFVYMKLIEKAHLINVYVPLAPWVKVYLVSGKKCLAKAKTSQENSPTISTYISDDYIDIHIEMKY